MGTTGSWVCELATFENYEGTGAIATSVFCDEIRPSEDVAKNLRILRRQGTQKLVSVTVDPALHAFKADPAKYVTDRVNVACHEWRWNDLHDRANQEAHG